MTFSVFGLFDSDPAQVQNIKLIVLFLHVLTAVSVCLVYLVVVVIVVVGDRRASGNCHPADWWRHAAAALL